MKKLSLKLFFAITVLFCVLSFNKVFAVDSSDGNIKVENELQENLVDSINFENNVYEINVKGSEMISLLTNTSLLNSNIQSNNLVYEYLYVKLAEEESSAKVTYNENSNLSLEIVDIDGASYAKCPFAVAKKIDGTFYHGFLHGDGIHVNTISENSGKISIYSDGILQRDIDFTADISESDTSFTGAIVYLESANSDNYDMGGTSCKSTSVSTYNRSISNEECYICVDLSVNVGETLSLNPFGTLSLSESSQTGKYTYKSKITDKTLFNKDSILCMILIPDYSVLHVSELTFEGEIVTDTPTIPPSDDTAVISIKDSTSNIKLDANSGVIPDDTTLSVETITSGDRFEEIKTILGNEKFSIFSISLNSNGTTIQPNGNVKISIPIPTGFNRDNLVVYRIDTDGTKTEYTVTIDGEYAVFETNHFSDYVLSEKAETSDNSGNSATDSTLDAEPKTGFTNPVSFVLSVLVISCLGLVVCIKKISK